MSKLILLDSIVSHLYVIYWSDKEGVKPKSNGTSVSSDFAIINSGSSGELSLAGTESVTSVPPVDEIASTVATTTSANTELAKELLTKLLDAFEIVKECTFKTIAGTLNGTIPDVLMERLMSIAGTKNSFCPDIVHQFASILATGQDKDVIAEWRKNLFSASDENFAASTFPVELHTLSVIDAHLTEVFKHPTYSVLLSLKHTLKSIVHLIYHLLPSCKDDESLGERVKTLLVPVLFDVRTEYMYTIANKCLLSLMDCEATSDAYQLLTFANVLQHSNRLLCDYSEMSAQGRNPNLDESVLHNVLKCWEQMLDKPIGLKALHEYFYVRKTGSLVQVLLSFTNTTLTQQYATKVLQFFERLFQACEKPAAAFKLDELCACVSELGQVDSLKLKNWLSHFLLGPGGGTQDAAAIFSTSAASSNVQTPTNMATVSAIPSISDQPSDLVLDPNAMDIDYECCSAGAAGPAGGASSSVWHAGTTITTTNRSGSDTPNEEYADKNGRLLQTLTKYIVAESRISPNVATALFQALIQLASNLLCHEFMEFTDLLQVNNFILLTI